MASTNITLLQVPTKYQSLFTWFQSKIIDFGTNLVDECNYYHTPEAQKLLSCWTMFQAACFAYNNNQDKKGDFLANYIIKELKLNISIGSSSSGTGGGSGNAPADPNKPSNPGDPDNPDDNPSGSDTPDSETKLVNVPRIRLSSGDITEENAIEKEFTCSSEVQQIIFVPEDSWCHIAPTEWTGGPKKFKIWVDCNESLSARKGTITMLINNDIDESFNVIQEANPNNLNWN